MTPTILIATHQRPYITELNIRSLYAQQKCMPTIVVVYSTQADHDYLRTKFLNLHLVQAPNFPLGLKWQTGVNYCRKIGADPLIILGSDDFLSCNSVHLGMSMLKYHDFVGFRSWSLYDLSNHHHYNLAYNRNVVFSNFTLGAGRFYSKVLLNRFDWKLFDITLDRNLDNLGHQQTTEHSNNPAFIKTYNEKHPWLMSIKGNWQCMNDTAKLLSSYNIDINPSFTKAKEIEQLYPSKLLKQP